MSKDYRVKNPYHNNRYYFTSHYMRKVYRADNRNVRNIYNSAERASIKFLLVNMYGNTCKYCKVILNKHNMTIDHIRPIALGGTWEMKNLQLLCKDCNSRKGDKWI